MKIAIWKKALSICGAITQAIGYFADSKTLIVIGLTSIVVGLIFICMLK